MWNIALDSSGTIHEPANKCLFFFDTRHHRQPQVTWDQQLWGEWLSCHRPSQQRRDVQLEPGVSVSSYLQPNMCLTVCAVYSMAQASKAIIPKDVGGPWGKRIGQESAIRLSAYINCLYRCHGWRFAFLGLGRRRLCHGPGFFDGLAAILAGHIEL